MTIFFVALNPDDRNLRSVHKGIRLGIINYYKQL